MDSSHRKPTFDQVISLVARRWATEVIGELARRPQTHNELARSIGIDHRQLDRSLGALVRRGVVRRTVVDRPHCVRYSLTGLGSDLMSGIGTLRSVVEASG